ncbi:uncharacterized protein LOC143217889 isoform X2 [Lasioglossum baleicum]|uniref:uncharacterized protein LOC143217889 isoform X2 n=1 Tax=Lasioglossum baleicum TaxID=434251 RepID=UPI003FCE8F68
MDWRYLKQQDCFIEHHCNRRSLKPGSVPTIFKREARFQTQQDVSVETNFTDKAQDVATMSKKENDEPRRNILMEINSIAYAMNISYNDTGPASITEQIPEASTIVGYSDSPTTSKDIHIICPAFENVLSDGTEVAGNTENGTHNWIYKS